MGSGASTLSDREAQRATALNLKPPSWQSDGSDLGEDTAALKAEVGGFHPRGYMR